MSWYFNVKIRKQLHSDQKWKKIYIFYDIHLNSANPT